jgi:hypothetical protein
MDYVYVLAGEGRTTKWMEKKLRRLSAVADDGGVFPVVAMNRPTAEAIVAAVTELAVGDVVVIALGVDADFEAVGIPTEDADEALTGLKTRLEAARRLVGISVDASDVEEEEEEDVEDYEPVEDDEEDEGLDAEEFEEDDTSDDEDASDEGEGDDDEDDDDEPDRIVIVTIRRLARRPSAAEAK